jgi:hypothetical protein
MTCPGREARSAVVWSAKVAPSEILNTLAMLYPDFSKGVPSWEYKEVMSSD